MITVHLLGPVDLRNAAHGELDVLLRQPKRVALLAYLASGPPGTFHQRETLLGLFWPESSQAQARHALSQALHVLREELGEHAIVTRGVGELALGRETLACDLWAFELAVAEDDLEQAVALYRGPLLHGVAVHASVEFDHWLESERERLARTYAAVLSRLAEACERRGALEDAVQWWRQLAALDPYGTQATLRLMTVLEAAGDRAGALAQAERQAARLREDLDAEPSPDVAAYATRLRQKPMAHQGDTPDVPFQKPCGVADRRSIESGSRFRRFTPRVLGSVAAALAIVGALLVARPRSRKNPDADVVAVAPFDLLGPGLDMWREGLVDMLSAALDGVGPLRTVAPSVGVQRWRGRTDGVSAEQFGRDVGAGLVVYGRLVEAGPDSVRASITLYDVIARLPLTELELRERGDRVERLADSAAVRLMETLSERRPLGAWRLASLGSSSPAALKVFLQGEQHWRGFNLDSARWYYERAIAIDSSFALAYNRLAKAVWWDLRSSGDWAVPILKAGALNHGLARRESLLLVADSIWGALPRFDGDSASWRLLRRLIPTLEFGAREYPLDPQVWYQLGEARYHYGPWLGVSRQDIAGAFERAVELDPRFTPAYWHLIELGLVLEGREAGLRAADGYLRGADSSRYRDAVEVTRALLAARPPDSAATMQLLATLSPEALYHVYFDLKWYPDSNETAVSVARAWAASADSADGRFALPLARAFRGHVTDTDRLSGGAFVLVFSELAGIGAVPNDSAAHTFARWLDAGSPRNSDRSWWERMSGAMPWWAERGDTSSLRRVVARADSLQRRGTERQQEVAAYWGAVAGDYLALARGDTASALRGFGSRPLWPICRMCYRPELTRARLLAAAGRTADAAATYDGLPMQLELVPLPGMVLATLERGRVHEALGNRAEAIASYLFVEAAWANGDPVVQPFVSEARAGLSRLAREF